ncbi:MAG: hypothetical protein IIY11_08620 [Clostridia bacterium]|jgi:hypothetical protein|nr:hypothetical protein [Clostridia bacterium]
MKKNRVPTEKELAVLDMLDAKEQLTDAHNRFNWASEAYFEVANSELTIAKMRYDNAITKVRMLCAESDYKDLPNISYLRLGFSVE